MGAGTRTVSRATLSLAVVAMVVAGNQRRIDIDAVGDGLAEAMSRENHLGRSEVEWISAFVRL